MRIITLLQRFPDAVSEGYHFTVCFNASVGDFSCEFSESLLYRVFQLEHGVWRLVFHLQLVELSEKTGTRSCDVIRGQATNLSNHLFHRFHKAVDLSVQFGTFQHHLLQFPQTWTVISSWNLKKAKTR